MAYKIIYCHDYVFYFTVHHYNLSMHPCYLAIIIVKTLSWFTRRIFFLFKLYIGIYVFRIGPLCMVYWSFFYMHAISNVFFLNQHSCIIFFPHIFLCSVKIVLPPTRTLTVYTAITIGMTCVSDIRDTLAQIYNVNGRILRNVTWA